MTRMIVLAKLLKLLERYDSLAEAGVNSHPNSSFGVLLIEELREEKEKLVAELASVDTNFSGCEGCKHIAFRYPYASMYPCIDCIRANSKDYYNVDLKEV